MTPWKHIVIDWEDAAAIAVILGLLILGWIRHL